MLLKTEFAEMIKAAVHEMFSAYLVMQLDNGPTVNKKDEDIYRPPSSEVTVVVNYSGGINGGIHLAAPLHVAMELASSFAGENFDSICGEAGDGFGELANIIAGGVQTRLGKGFGNINLTPPTLVTGTDYRMQYKSNFDSVKQYFKCDAGLFFVEFFFYVQQFKGR
ncbi:MAG: chemotaxis protein CheX [Magnetococcales bacterium]|nr:chemotaxis protein CheX [Magnetococcales bacterium]NGZ05008.1 chemotaxis protein CheX [Magnetococcales bacterium]